MTEDFGKLPVTEVVTRRIQEMIRSGEFPPDSRLPSQRVLSERLGVSRASLREALLTLETLGLIRTLPARGTFVSGERTQAPKAGENWRHDARHTIAEVFQTRLAIEGEMCRLAAAQMTPPQLEALATAAQLFETAWRNGDLLAHVEADLDFHSLIADSCGNGMLRMFYRSIHDVLTESQRVPIPNTEVSRMEASIAEHHAILAALRSGDGSAAARAMRTHIGNTAQIAGVVVPV
ncbi:FadR/GntR family transcriptional regulator [Mangrovicoccus algicola]|uniref:FadR family transcriptional regulator n=1 Tax=Mangrovicoccus algicola TaxID=2771008 RepID=A0A8J6YYL2_9RHOB|nr:FadR/GntR family transcriptional regulator [Mangrovicoccus algicola]MBE3640030.1 FadR family transcriptional regulator [Mangrovicoccus algicola]